MSLRRPKKKSCLSQRRILLISISVKEHKLQAKMEALIVQQLPFALSRGLNRTMRIARDNHLRPAYDNTFNRRNTQFFKGVHTISNSDKKQWRQYGVLIAAIQERDNPPPIGSKRGGNEKKRMDTSFMKAHVIGGNRYPKRSKKFVPFSDAPIKRRTGGAQAGKVVASASPKRLYPQSGSKTFIREVKGTPVLFKRTGRGKGQKIQRMYHLQPVVYNKSKYKPLPIVRRAVDRHIGFTLNRSIIDAIKTARLR